jgi:hypothetical protein
VLEEQAVIVTIARVTDPDRFLMVFETAGAEKRRGHGCRGAGSVSIPTTLTGLRTPRWSLCRCPLIDGPAVT